jgi:hypothetical protein
MLYRKLACRLLDNHPTELSDWRRTVLHKNWAITWQRQQTEIFEAPLEAAHAAYHELSQHSTPDEMLPQSLYLKTPC